jgi:hypothetical protein
MFENKDEKKFFQEKDRALKGGPILTEKTQPKTVEIPASAKLEEIRVEQKALYDRMKNDQPISKGEWLDLARHAKKAMALAEPREHKDFQEIIDTAKNFAG